MSVCCIQSLMCLNLKVNFHLYIRCYVLFTSYGHVATDPLIRKHSLQLVVWKCYSTCPDLLIDLSHLILKICCMCVCGGSPLVDLVISGTDWCWHANTNLELDLSFTDGINTWYAHIYWVLGFTLHANHVLFHIIYTLALSSWVQIMFQLSHLFVLSCISVLVVWLQICYSACTFIVYI